MATRADNLHQTPIHHATVALPGDATDHLVQLGGMSPDGGACKRVRWLGSGAATLWYVPATPRTADGYTASEIAATVPNARGALKRLFFAQGEAVDIQAIALDDASTAGNWEVTF